MTEDFSSLEKLPNNSGRLRVALEIAVAVSVLVGIYYFFAPEEDMVLPPLPPQAIDPIIRAQIDAAEQQTKADTDTPTPVADTIAPSPTGAEPSQQTAESTSADENLPEGGAARRLIANLREGSVTLTEAEILDQAQSYQEKGATSDAYLLLFYSARQGGGQAAFNLASLYDPNHFSEGSSLLQKPDTYQAHKWYSKAASQNIPQAEARLQALRNSIQKQAEKGDMAARRLLLNWQ
ncbi:MAG: SEL1-like repeat protein [Candidatus Thiodiazotropha sp. (ex Monitilora ramsayi)]|nr:SEL1-like repeat protein [Candidatus Thiodiazotropha sp. (ex Monitilora ramsayi)]